MTAADEKRKPGRPTIGGLVKVALGEGLLSLVVQQAEAAGVSRAEMVRRLVSAGAAALLRGPEYEDTGSGY